jgi:hypothetical protein
MNDTDKMAEFRRNIGVPDHSTKILSRSAALESAWYLVTKQVLRAVDFVMTADIEQENLLIGDHDCKRNAVAVGYAHRLESLQFTAQVVKLQVGLKRVTFQVTQDGDDLGAQVRMACKKLLCRASEAGGPDQGIHAQSPRPSSLINSSAVPRVTLPAATSCNDAFTRAWYASSASATNSW